MSEAAPKKVAYLFGAGATHAELAEIEPNLASEDTVKRRRGLLMTNVSARVIKMARLNSRFLKGVEFLEPPRDLEGVEPGTEASESLNIELLISLIENSKIHGWERKTQLLKRLVQEAIEEVLTPRRRSRFYLHKALLDFHSRLVTQQREQLVGLISLNYDSVLDEAYEEFYGRPNYCFSLETSPRSSGHVPLLKLHGSFNWARGVTIRQKRRKIEPVPLGSNKSYLHTPYNFIWNRALEVLVGCDTLRVVGCSLGQNDTHLVDLLFKAHLEKTPSRMKTFEMEIISRDADGERIRKEYGFFPDIKRLTKIRDLFIGDSDPRNPFWTWLAAKVDRTFGDNPEPAGYLRKLKLVS
jgi:SIR2-like domain